MYHVLVPLTHTWCFGCFPAISPSSEVERTSWRMPPSVSLHDEMESLGIPTNHFVPFPFKKNENNQSQTYSCEVYLSHKGLHISKKLQICSWGFSWSSPPNIPLDWKSCRIVFVTYNAEWFSIGGRRIALCPAPPIELHWSQKNHHHNFCNRVVS